MILVSPCKLVPYIFSRRKILFLLIFIDAVKLQKEPEKKNRVRVTLHYGDEIQSIVEAIADTIDAFKGSVEWLVQLSIARG